MQRMAHRCNKGIDESMIVNGIIKNIIFTTISFFHPFFLCFSMCEIQIKNPRRAFAVKERYCFLLFFIQLQDFVQFQFIFIKKLNGKKHFVPFLLFSQNTVTIQFHCPLFKWLFIDVAGHSKVMFINQGAQLPTPSSAPLPPSIMLLRTKPLN